MNIEDLFNEKEIETLNGPALQQKAQEIKQRFDILRSSAHQIRNNPLYLNDVINIHRDLTEFDKNQFNPWNQKWGQIFKSGNVSSISSFFNEGKIIFENILNLFNNYSPEYYQSEDINSLKVNVLSNLEEDFFIFRNDMMEKIDSELKKLVNYSSELNLQKNFSESIKNEKIRSNRLRIGFLVAFILTLIVSGVLLGFLPQLINLENSDIWNNIILRISIILPIGFLSYFLFNQYKLYQIVNMKYTHMDGFIAGGATFLSQMINDDYESKKNINNRLANMFLEIDDVLVTMKKEKHPADNSFENALKAYDSITKGLSNVVNEVSKLK